MGNSAEGGFICMQVVVRVFGLAMQQNLLMSENCSSDDLDSGCTHHPRSDLRISLI